MGENLEGVSKGGAGRDDRKLSVKKVLGDDDLRELRGVQVILDVVQ